MNPNLLDRIDEQIGSLVASGNRDFGFHFTISRSLMVQNMLDKLFDSAAKTIARTLYKKFSISAPALRIGRFLDSTYGRRTADMLHSVVSEREMISTIESRIDDIRKMYKSWEKAQPLEECGDGVNVEKPDDLKELMKGVSLGEDDDGFYVYTHRARTKSYKTPYKIPKSKIDFIASTS